jgi:nickel-dependent lactate racemase
MNTIQIAYGKRGIPLELDPSKADWTILEPAIERALTDPVEEFKKACREPIGTVPLSDIIHQNDRVVIVTADGTRPVPNSVLIPWLLDVLRVSHDRVTVLIGTGSHRPNTRDEIDAMFGRDLASRIQILNHDAFDPTANTCVGNSRSGTPISFNTRYVEADKRIALGFIEPHFVAGFSGGPKAIAPGIASIDTIFNLHSRELIGHPGSTWGRLDDNPLHEAINDAVALCPPDFMANVTLNADKEITGVWCGDYRAAHRAGCDHVREHAMVAVPGRFPVVITSNSGYPLDQNLYQSVKGMSAAALIVEDAGTMFVASECSDGVPSHGNFGRVLADHATVESIDAWLRTLEKPVLDQWQIQLLNNILRRCSVRLHSALDHETVHACKLLPCDHFQQSIDTHLRGLGRRVPVAVLPQGPLTIPYVADT